MKRIKRSLILFAISAAALLLAAASYPPLRPVELQAGDILMRWRHDLTHTMGLCKTSDEVALVAIDNETQVSFGKLKNWYSRQHFLNQLMCFEQVIKPSVLAYDIVFQPSVSEAQARGVSVLDTPGLMTGVIEHLRELESNSAGSVSMETLEVLNRFTGEQGDRMLADRLASIREQGSFEVLLGYNLINGWVDPQSKIRPWSLADICGDRLDGSEEHGERLPYLKDVAIPEADLHWPDRLKADAYEASINAGTPARELLDYSRLTYLNAPRDEDSVIRRIPLVAGVAYDNPVTGTRRVFFVPSISLASCALHLGLRFPLKPGDITVEMGRRIVIRAPAKTVTIPVDERGRMLVNFNGTIEDFIRTSFHRVAPNLSAGGVVRIPVELKDRLDGRIVLVGSTLSGEDVGATPIMSNVSLVFVHMMAVSNILEGAFIRPVTGWRLLVLAGVLYLVFTLACHVPSSRLVPASLLATLLYLLVAFAGVQYDLYLLPVVSPVVYMGLCVLGVSTYNYLTEVKERRKIRSMFSTMVSDRVLDYLEEHPDSFSVRGQSSEVTILFSDICDFTRMSEKLPSTRVTELLNRYFNAVADSIMVSGGYLDKFIGDGVMAVWGVPYADETHATKACLSALEQIRIVETLAPLLQREFGVLLKVRIGINSGLVTAGNMGSDRKFQYTVTGDPVNFAARLEHVNKDFGTSILLGEATYRLASHAVEARRLGRVTVVGKMEPVLIYELLGEKGKVSAERLNFCHLYEQALELYHTRQWKACIALVDHMLASVQDGAAAFLRVRAAECMMHEPGPDWKGEYVRADKY